MQGREIQRWICAALKREGAPTTAERLSRMIPGHPEPHHISQQLWVLKRKGVIEKLGTGARGKPAWRLLDDALLNADDVLTRIQAIEKATREPVALYSNRDAIRTEILACLNPPAFGTDSKPVLSKQDIMAHCPSTRSEHEVSQILAEMVDSGRIIGEGQGRKRRYWMAKDQQMDLLQFCAQAAQAEIEQTEKTIRIVLHEGIAMKRKRALNGAVMANYDRHGQFLDLIINKELLSETA